jgi:hypothetical protein
MENEKREKEGERGGGGEKKEKRLQEWICG